MEPYPSLPHNLVTYVQPLPAAPTANELLEDPEHALLENAIWHFINNDSWTEKDRVRLEKMYERYGVNMFVWKYYRAARCYIGGYKALAATLMLRKL